MLVFFSAVDEENRDSKDINMFVAKVTKTEIMLKLGAALTLKDDHNAM